VCAVSRAALSTLASLQLVASEGSPYRGDVLDRLELTKDRVRRALPRLLATAEIESVKGGYRVVDPLLAEWVECVGD
jgi:hypothetical protein